MTTRRLFTALALTPAILQAHDEDANPALDRTSMIHGATGPFAIAGYRMGFAALRELKLRRGSFDLEVIHHAPREVQWSCIIDGLQAATGASLGKLNLTLAPSTANNVYSIVRNRKTGQAFRIELTPAFIKQHMNIPSEKLSTVGAQLADVPEDQIFTLKPLAR